MGSPFTVSFFDGAPAPSVTAHIEIARSRVESAPAAYASHAAHGTSGIAHRESMAANDCLAELLAWSRVANAPSTSRLGASAGAPLVGSHVHVEKRAAPSP
ncbi:MAG TPA: hypothetical protein VK841_13245 [Polyangiaceae bacterium]|jgi:hypothetical protein|nr:hypothetical protein [Polyangiaceae bacterium]